MSAPRTRLVWHKAEIIRTACALAAYAVIGVVGMSLLYGFCLGIAALGEVLGLS